VCVCVSYCPRWHSFDIRAPPHVCACVCNTVFKVAAFDTIAPPYVCVRMYVRVCVRVCNLLSKAASFDVIAPPCAPPDAVP
jgi:hypothetical protein